MNITILEFCEIFEIRWQPIKLNFDLDTGKKILSKCFCKDGYSYMPQPDDFTKNIISINELNKRQSYINEFNYIAIDTCNFYHIDVDEKEYIDKVDDLLKFCPYFLSSTKKLPHIIYKSKVKYNKHKCETIYKYNSDKGYINPIEILSGLWSYCHKDELIYNFVNDIPELNIDFVKINHDKEFYNKSLQDNIIIETEKSINNKDNDYVEFDKDKMEFIKKLEICYKTCRIEIYDDWLNLLFAYKNELGNYGYELFDNLSKQVKDNKKYNKAENLKIWNKTEIRTSGKRKTLYHMVKWAREDNENKYNILMNENNFDDYVNININYCEKDIANYVITKFLKFSFVCSDVKNLQFYFFNGVRWIEDTNNIKLYKIITEELVDDYHNIKNCFCDDKNIKKIDKIIDKLKGKISYFNNIVEHIALLIFNHEFLNKIDENPDLIGFDDCIYDLIEKKTRKGKPEDYVSKSVGFNFPTQYTEYKKDIEIFLSQVFPNQDVRNYVLQQHAQALSGRKGKDTIHTNTGIGGNGKSILIELLKHSFGQYYCNIPIKMLISQNNNNNNHNTPEPFFSKLKGVRLAGACEPPDGAKINDSFLKLVGSQEEQDFRVLFSNVINKLTLQLKLHIFCNDKLKLKGEDGGIGRRMKVINYISRFDEQFNEKNNIFKIDYTLSNKVKLWKADYIKMLIDLYDVNYIYSCPVEIEEASKQYIDDNNDVLKFVKDFFIFTNDNNNYLLFKDIKELYKQNKEYEQSKIKDLKKLLEKTMNCVVHERKKINNVDYRGVILGWTLIDNIDN